MTERLMTNNQTKRRIYPSLGSRRRLRRSKHVEIRFVTQRPLSDAKTPIELHSKLLNKVSKNEIAILLTKFLFYTMRINGVICLIKLSDFSARINYRALISWPIKMATTLVRIKLRR